MSKIGYLSDNKHAIEKNVLAGSHSLITQQMISCKNGKYFKENVEFVVSVLKLPDECIVNITDHFVNCINKRALQQFDNPNIARRFVRNVSVSIANNGQITMKNDGYGIPIIERTLKMDTKTITQYIPELLFTNMRTGTNMEKDKYSLTGGTNGQGACLITLKSTILILDIADGINRYQQNIKSDGTGEIISETPKITKCTDHYTSVSFIPNWASSGYKKLTPKVKNSISDWLYKRVNTMSLYFNTVAELCSVPRPVLKFNNKIVNQDFEILKKNQDVKFSFVIPMKLKKKDFGYNVPQLCSLKLFIGINTEGTDKNSIKFSIIR